MQQTIYKDNKSPFNEPLGLDISFCQRNTQPHVKLIMVYLLSSSVTAFNEITLLRRTPELSVTSGSGLLQQS